MQVEYNPRIMRYVSHCLLIFSLVFVQGPRAPKLFPIPTTMQKMFPGADLNDADTKLLRKSLEADLGSLDQECGDESLSDSLALAGVDLGKLGKGVIVAVHGSCMCGATGDCPMFVYAREKDRFRQVASSGGWAYGVVKTEAAIPDLVFASKGGGMHIYLNLYRYSGDKFVERGCELLTPKGDNGPTSWWDPSQVVVRPCEKQK